MFGRAAQTSITVYEGAICTLRSLHSVRTLERAVQRLREGANALQAFAEVDCSSGVSLRLSDVQQQ